MALSTLLSRATGFGRVFALAYAFGFTRLTDTYNLANTTPNIVFDLVLGGVLAATLVPVFVEWLSTSDDDDAWYAISAVTTIALVSLAAISAGLALAAPLVVRAYTLRLSGAAATEQRSLAVALLRMFAPQVFLYGAITILGATLNARRRFIAPMITPVLNNLVVIAVLLLVPHVARGLSLSAFRSGPVGVALLGLGTTAGVALQAIALSPALRRAGVRLRPVWAPNHPAVRRVLRLSGWTLAYIATNHVALWVVLVLANSRSGNVSAYQAAYMFFQLPFGVVAVTVMTVLQPEMAKRSVEGDRAGLTVLAASGIQRIAFLLVPAALTYGLVGRTLLTVALRHGALAAQSARTTGDVLALLAIGLPAFGVFLFLMSAYQAMQDARAMFRIYCIENAVNIALAVALYPGFGVRGLAVAFALSYVVGAFIASIDIQRRLGQRFGVGRQIRGIAVAGLGAALIGSLLHAAIRGVVAIDEQSRIGLELIVGVVAYVSLGALAKAPDALAVVRFVRRVGPRS